MLPSTQSDSSGCKLVDHIADRVDCDYESLVVLFQLSFVGAPLSSLLVGALYKFIYLFIYIVSHANNNYKEY